MDSPSLGVTIWRAMPFYQTGLWPRRLEQSEVYAHTQPVSDKHSLSNLHLESSA